ncbi:hypothetical protein ElyMa_003094800 [Elysia marginata]|uniref:Uncharacterized protein n=1 Tax=Elysia marginata TaxID=1093978 RepID=A0AAV4ING3_9GAST|nr:hypothetical protein ElyMa_003094800 [Elysia marginata]
MIARVERAHLNDSIKEWVGLGHTKSPLRDQYKLFKLFWSLSVKEKHQFSKFRPPAAMSFLKFWSSKKSGGGKKDDPDSKHGDGTQDPELEKRRLRHSLSISRSGRFKQRKRERSQIMDKPEIFDCQDGGHATASVSSSSSSSLASQTHSESENRRGTKTSGSTQAQSHHFRSAASSSPNFSCRDVNPGMGGSPGRMRISHPVVT